MFLPPIIRCRTGQHPCRKRHGGIAATRFIYYLFAFLSFHFIYSFFFLYMCIVFIYIFFFEGRIHFSDGSRESLQLLEKRDGYDPVLTPATSALFRRKYMLESKRPKVIIHSPQCGPRLHWHGNIHSLWVSSSCSGSNPLYPPTRIDIMKIDSRLWPICCPWIASLDWSNSLIEPSAMNDEGRIQGRVCVVIRSIVVR